MDGHTWYGTWITGRHQIHLDIQSVGAQPTDGVDEQESTLALEVAADEEHTNRSVGARLPVTSSGSRPRVVVHPGRDHDDLLGGHLVAVDEATLGPLRPGHDAGGAGEAGPVGPPLETFGERVASVVPVVLAELVVLDRRGIERHDGRDAGQPVGHEDRRDLGVDEHRIERALTLQCPHGATGPDPGADCPVAHPRDARGGALTGELDWREGGVDALVGADEGLEVGGMRHVPERLLEHERDARRLPHAAAWSKRASKSAGSPSSSAMPR